MTEKKRKIMLHIPGQTADAYKTLADLAGVTPEQAMAVALAVSLLRFVSMPEDK